MKYNVSTIGTELNQINGFDSKDKYDSRKDISDSIFFKYKITKQICICCLMLCLVSWNIINYQLLYAIWKADPPNLTKTIPKNSLIFF